MKPQMIYGLIFLIAFLSITGILYFAAGKNPDILYISALHSSSNTNSNSNISGSDSSDVEFDYRKRLELQSDVKEGEFYVLTDTLDGQIVKTKVEVRYDTIFTQKLVTDPSVLDSLKKIETKLNSSEKELKKNDEQIKNLQNQIIRQKDSVYTEWVKSTVKLYEQMDSKKVAKLIGNLSDSEVRDLFKKMKTRKVVDIMANLSDERVSRLTGLK